MTNNLSYWEKKHFFKADVIIVGAGIVGLNAAIAIKEKNQKIAWIRLNGNYKVLKRWLEAASAGSSRQAGKTKAAWLPTNTSPSGSQHWYPPRGVA